VRAESPPERKAEGRDAGALGSVHVVSGKTRIDGRDGADGGVGAESKDKG
jgi:hypothetical protein